jgi:hypothetical protein
VLHQFVGVLALTVAVLMLYELRVRPAATTL